MNRLNLSIFRRFSRRTFFTAAILISIAIAIPVTLLLINQKQDNRQRASGTSMPYASIIYRKNAGFICHSDGNIYNVFGGNAQRVGIPELAGDWCTSFGESCKDDGFFVYCTDKILPAVKAEQEKCADKRIIAPSNLTILDSIMDNVDPEETLKKMQESSAKSMPDSTIVKEISTPTSTGMKIVQGGFIAQSLLETIQQGKGALDSAFGHEEKKILTCSTDNKTIIKTNVYISAEGKLSSINQYQQCEEGTVCQISNDSCVKCVATTSLVASRDNGKDFAFTCNSLDSNTYKRVPVYPNNFAEEISKCPSNTVCSIRLRTQEKVGGIDCIPGTTTDAGTKAHLLVSCKWGYDSEGMCINPSCEQKYSISSYCQTDGLQGCIEGYQSNTALDTTCTDQNQTAICCVKSTQSIPLPTSPIVTNLSTCGGDPASPCSKCGGVDYSHISDPSNPGYVGARCGGYDASSSKWYLGCMKTYEDVYWCKGTDSSGRNYDAIRIPSVDYACQDKFWCGGMGVEMLSQQAEVNDEDPIPDGKVNSCNSCTIGKYQCQFGGSSYSCENTPIVGNSTCKLCQLVSPTQTVLKTVSPSPTGSSCSLKNKGDVNCDGKINNLDSQTIQQQIFNGRSGNGDVNRDGIVNLVDFLIWRQNAQ